MDADSQYRCREYTYLDATCVESGHFHNWSVYCSGDDDWRTCGGVRQRRGTDSGAAHHALVYRSRIHERTISLRFLEWSQTSSRFFGHNLESSQTWGFCMDFLYHREGGMVFTSVFPPFSFTVYSNVPVYRSCKRLREFEEIEISRQSCRGDCE